MTIINYFFMRQYDHREIEKKWQKIWDNEKTFATDDDNKSDEFYALDMFPYPSGAGLHVGHPEGYIATDIMSRFRRIKYGDNVLHPMGFDSFGLPTENYAIKMGRNPKEITEENVGNFVRQLKMFGFSYDWDRMIKTSDPEYYKWTQWMFREFYKKGLAYKKEAPVNWCESCQTVLAREQVVDGKCERCKDDVIQKNLSQWFFKITEYADELLEEIEKLDWPEAIKTLQKNWIGRSEGAEVDFGIVDSEENLRVFTTRPDTLFGVTFMVVAPEHSVLEDNKNRIDNFGEIEEYIKQAQKKNELERTDLNKDKTGIEVKGLKAINPVNNEEIPIFVADYVMMNYGTGAIMAVPAHDERDFEFADNNNISIRHVVEPDYNNFDAQKIISNTAFGKREDLSIEDSILKSVRFQYSDIIKKGKETKAFCFSGNGVSVNSGKFNGLSTEEFKKKIINWLEENKKGKKKTQYKLRDWLVSRQRYWGAPIPVIYCEKCAKKKPTVLLVHGTGGNGRKHWFGWLADNLREQGYEVIAPDLPNPDKPVLEEWLEELDKYKNKIDENTIIIGHSLGSPVSLRFINSLNKKIDKLILVASIGKRADWEKYAKNNPGDPVENIKNISEMEIDFENIKKNVRDVIYYYSDNDQYIQSEVNEYYKANMEAEYRLRRGYNHFSVTTSGMSEFPELLSEIEKSRSGEYLADDELVELPDDVDFKPTGESPLKSSESFHENVKCPKCGTTEGVRREVDTMDTFVCSSWYFLRYVDPHNTEEPFDREKVNKWLPVDLYVGGAEHAVMHLLYARFFTKALADMGHIDFREPFQKLRNQGMILAEDGRKMSKSLGNVVNPDEVVERFGSDTFRLYEMFMGPLEDSKPWNTNSIAGVRRFIDRVWGLQDLIGEKTSEEVKKVLHQTIKKVTEDIEMMKYNTAISAMMILVNTIEREKIISRDDLVSFVIVLNPFAPHVTEELWEIFGGEGKVSEQEWPKWDESLIKEEEITIAVQVNGKVRDEIVVNVDEGEEQVKEKALGAQGVQKWIEGKEVKKVICVKGKLVSVVVG